MCDVQMSSADKCLNVLRSLCGSKNDEVAMRVLPKKVNLFFRHLLTSKQEPFSEVSEESLEPYSVTMDNNRTRFYYEVLNVLRHFYPSHDENFITTTFERWAYRDWLLYEFSVSLRLKETLNLFESGDMRADVRYSELVLVFLSAVDFDFDTILQLVQSVSRRNYNTDLVRNGRESACKSLHEESEQARQQAWQHARQQGRQMNFISKVCLWIYASRIERY